MRTPDATAVPPVDGGQPVAAGRRALLRRAVAAATGLLVLCGLVAVTGLLGTPTGAADNGDGDRLFCGAGLVPRTPDQVAEWRGGVVLDFGRTDACADPSPSSALLLLRLATVGTAGDWSLTRLGWTYVVLFTVVAAAAAWAAGARGPARVLVLAPAVLPLLQADVARFLLSTYAEPAGLLGAFTLVAGVGVVAVTRPEHRAERVIGLVLVAGGGLVAGTAKAAYLPLLAVAVALCAVTAVGRGRRRLVGPGAAVVVALAALGPVSAALAWQAEGYGRVNVHNLVYTTVLTEVPGSAADLGLPDAAAASAGTAYFPEGRDGAAGAEVVAADPAAVRERAWRVLFDHPTALARAVGVGLQATRGQALEYLPSAPWTPQTRPPALGTAVGAQGADAGQLRAWLDGMALPWWPSLLTGLGIAAGIAGLRWRASLGSALARTAGVAAGSALGLAAVAVLGDGYFEVAKHVWLAAYLLDVTVVALAGAALAVVVAVVRRRTS
ncbi:MULTISPECIES: glycan biosynthesis hexose transferase WsfD [unclassified Modestobacter]